LFTKMVNTKIVNQSNRKTMKEILQHMHHTFIGQMKDCRMKFRTQKCPKDNKRWVML